MPGTGIAGGGRPPSGRTRAPRRAPGRGLSAGGQSGERDVWTEVDAQTQTGLTVSRQTWLWGGRVESAAGPQAVIVRPPHSDRHSDAQCGDHVVGHINVALPYRTPDINLIPYASCKLNVKEKRPPSSKCLVLSKGEMAGHWPRCPSCETRPQREARRGGDVTQPAVGPRRSSELAGLTPWLLRGFAGTPWCCRSPRVVFSGGCAS